MAMSRRSILLVLTQANPTPFCSTRTVLITVYDYSPRYSRWVHWTLYRSSHKAHMLSYYYTSQQQNSAHIPTRRLGVDVTLAPAPMPEFRGVPGTAIFETDCVALAAWTCSFSFRADLSKRMRNSLL